MRDLSNHMYNKLLFPFFIMLHIKSRLLTLTIEIDQTSFPAKPQQKWEMKEAKVLLTVTQ